MRFLGYIYNKLLHCKGAHVTLIRLLLSF